MKLNITVKDSDEALQAIVKLLEQEALQGESCSIERTILPNMSTQIGSLERYNVDINYIIKIRRVHVT